MERVSGLLCVTTNSKPVLFQNENAVTVVVCYFAPQHKPFTMGLRFRLAWSILHLQINDRHAYWHT